MFLYMALDKMHISNFPAKNMMLISLRKYLLSSSFKEFSIKFDTVMSGWSIIEALSGVLRNRGIYFRVTGEQRLNFEGPGEQRQYWGTGNITFLILGNMGTSQFISGEQGNWYPPGRAALCI